MNLKDLSVPPPKYILNLYNNMGGTHRHNFEQKKPNLNVYILCDSV